MKSGYTPIPPSEPDIGTAAWRDKAAGGYSMAQLERLVKDCGEQPTTWRARSDLCHAYYDGKQLTDEQRMFIEAEGLDARSTNLIARVINSVLGQEARNRTDVRIESDSGEIADVTDVLNPAFKEAHRESYADMAVSAAYSGQVKGGVGWVEVSKDPDPLNYPYRVRDVHRNEMWWDWTAKDFLLRDARWQVRSQWHDLDELEASMPKHREVLRQMANNWAGYAMNHLVQDVGASDSITRAFDDFSRFRVRSSEWLDTVRKRVRLYEVWYKVPAYAVVMRLGPTRTVLFDEKNVLHQMAVSRNLVKLERALSRQIRKAIFAGPYRLTDVGTNRRNFPYVPFFAFRDDADGSPYGLVDGMISPQDEYNDRRLRIQWMLRARQILVDNDALDPAYNNLSDLADEAQRPDMILVRNAMRKNANGVEILSNLSLQKEQVDVMNDAKLLIQDVPGVYGSQMGQAQGGVTANSAMVTLVEQGMISMGELNDNYRNARRMVFENLMDLIVEDHDQADLQVMVGEGASRRMVVLNTIHPETQLPENIVKEAPIRMGLSDTASSPAARAGMQTQISEIIKSLGNMPQAVAVLVPAFIESSALDSETRRQVAEDFRKVAGLPSGGDRAARQQAEKAQQEQGAQQQQAAQATAAAALAEQQAKATKLLADADFSKARASQIRQDPAANDQAINDALAEANGAPQGTAA